MNSKNFSAEVASGERFPFGMNWTRFLETLSDSRIEQAERSIVDMLELSDLRGMSFLDVGSGSGIFSLVAHRLGADVHSFDYDPSSVACTRQVRTLYARDGVRWQIERGSALDQAYMESLGRFDIVYAWGVLHHTGDLWTSLAYAADRVRAGGSILLAVYNDQGMKSRLWLWIKRFYCSGIVGRSAVVGTVFPYFFLRILVSSCLSMRNLFSKYSVDRGMSLIRNWHDWCGGLPYEVASVEAIFRFFSDRHFILRNIRTKNGSGNNQFVFQARGPQLDGPGKPAVRSVDEHPFVDGST